MKDNQNRLDELLEKYSRSEINEPEFNELCSLINEPNNDAALKGLLEQGFSNASFVEMDKGKLDVMLQKVLRTSPPTPLLKEKGASIRSIWRRVAAAAAVLVCLSVGSYLVFKNNSNKELATNKPQENKFKNDVAAPMKAKATITLADGSTVALDSVGYGKLAIQGNVNVMVTADGRLVYREQSEGPSTPLRMQYNTLTNPRGSKVVDMTLADGSRVWLNAGSSVTYPVAFVGNEREVSITGEAYFEVIHNAAMPFKVTKGEMEVTDLGTSFNVNAYDDEPEIKVTLLEGSVKIRHAAKDDKGIVMKPGEQAQVTTGIKIVKGIDLEEVMAWKNGKFYFNGADIETIMRQVARWYDVEVVYEGGIPTGHYNGKPSKDLTAAEMLKVVEYSGVKVRIEGKKIIVLK